MFDKLIFKARQSKTIFKIKRLLAERLATSAVFSLFCQEKKLGNEWTLEYVERTIWLSDDPLAIYLKVGEAISSH